MKLHTIDMKNYKDFDLKALISKNGEYEYNQKHMEEFIKNPYTVLFVATEENAIVGFAYGYILPLPEYTRPVLQICAIELVDAYKNVGAGKIMLKGIIECANKEDAFSALTFMLSESEKYKPTFSKLECNLLDTTLYNFQFKPLNKK